MKINATFRAPSINIERFKQTLHQQMSEAIADAVFSWLNATTALIPVWSGASLATFLKLASELRLPLEITPVVKSRVNLGLENSTGNLDVNSTTGQYKFSYSTTLQHLIFNEFNNANDISEKGFPLKLINPGPYHFQKAGQEAFEKVAASVRLPNPLERIQVRIIRAK